MKRLYIESKIRINYPVRKQTGSNVPRMLHTEEEQWQ